MATPDALPERAIARLGTSRQPGVVHEGEVGAVAFAADGRSIVAAHVAEPVFRYDIATGQAIECVASERTGYDHGRALSPDGALLARQGAEQATLLDVATGRSLATLTPPDSTEYGLDGPAPHVMAFSGDARTLVIGGWQSLADASTDDTRPSPGRLWLFDVPGGTVPRLTIDTGDEFSPHDVAVSADGSRIATAHGGKIRIYSADGRLLEAHELPPRAERFRSRVTTALSLSVTGVLAVGEYDGLLMTYGPGSSPQTLDQGPSSRIAGAAFAPEGTRLAVAHEDGTVRLWDAATGVEVTKLKASASATGALAFSRDGRRLASGHVDATIMAWDLT